MKKFKKKVKLKSPHINGPYKFMFEKGYVPKKYNVVYGGTGSSKSFTLLTLFIRMCLKYKTFDILIARKYATTLKDTVETPLINIMTKYYQNVLSGMGLIEGRDYKYNRTFKHIKFSSGSIIRFKGYDNPEKLKGIDNVNVLWLEEATDFSQEDLEDIQDRLRSTPPDNHHWGKELKLFITFNPIYKTHWIRTYFFEDQIDMTDEIHIDIPKDDDTTMALKTTWRDNDYYNGQYKNEKLRDNMKVTNPRKFGVQCNGNWGVLGELIFENWEVISCNKDDSYYDDVSHGLDFGFGHNTGFYKIGKKDNDIYIYKGFYKSKLTISDIENEVKKCVPESYNNYTIFGDNARPEAIEQMKRNGFCTIKACKKGANSVIEGIEWMQDRKIYVDESLKGLINEMESYQWEKDKRTGERLPKPVKVNDDAIDAVRYGCQKFRDKRNLRFDL